MKLLLAITLIITGCAGFHVAPQQDPDLVPYMLDYRDDCMKYHDAGYCLDAFQVSARFGRLEVPVVGLCEQTEDGDFLSPHTKRIITIDERAWRYMYESERHILVYHELGHCHLHREHLDTKGGLGLPDEFPTSVMNSYVIPGWAFDAHHDYYILELFNGPN